MWDVINHAEHGGISSEGFTECKATAEGAEASDDNGTEKDRRTQAKNQTAAVPIAYLLSGGLCANRRILLRQSEFQFPD